jgi:hypothetical protein
MSSLIGLLKNKNSGCKSKGKWLFKSQNKTGSAKIVGFRPLWAIAGQKKGFFGGWQQCCD